MKHFYLLIFVFSYVFIGSAQVKSRYFPNNNALDHAEYIKNDTKTNKIKDMPPFNLREMIEEDKRQSSLDVPFRFGKGFDTNITLSDGEWTEIPEGRIWSLGFRSKGANSINFVFQDFYLAEGSKLYITNKEKTMLYGSVTSENNTKNGHFLTDLIQSDWVIIYLFEPLNQIGKCNLNIKRVVHAYRNMSEMTNGNLGGSENCNNNINCFPARDLESDAVGLVLLSDGTEWCSGALLMSADQSFRPFFLTAFHCIDTSENGILSAAEQNNAEDWLFKFQYKMTTCAGNTASTGITYNGSNFRAAWNNTDFTLMEMQNSPLGNNQISWLGWDRTGNIPTSGVGIHHPAGDVMKISIENNQFQMSNWNGVNNHWLLSFDDGIVQHGSSGSPILNQNNRVVGQLHGNQNYNSGQTYCTQPRAEYGRFYQSWTGGGTNSTRLSNWLDPYGSGIMTTNTARSPYISGSNTVCTSNTTFTLQDASPSSVTWQVSPNVQLVSSNNSNATIRSIYANSTSTGWIKASFDGLVITKDFGVNGDVDEIPMNVTVNLVNNYLTITIHDGSGQTPYYLYLNNAYKLSTNSRVITFPYYHNSGRIEIRNRNSCDTGWNYAFYTGYFGGSYYYNYTIFPNPASEILTLKRKEDSIINHSKNPNFDINEKNRYELYNYNQVLVSKGQINNLEKIDVSGFKSGLYILLIITEGVYESHHLMIN